MDTAYISAIAALSGSAIGGLTSLMASWLSQHVQFSAQETARQKGMREDLYKDFIEEASRWYADAYEHDTARISNLVGLYAMVNKMRVISSPPVVGTADEVVRVIIETYRAPNKTFNDVTELLDDETVNPLRNFSTACREELADQAAGLPYRRRFTFGRSTS